MTRSPDFDAVIVGARCAGAAAALTLARAGARVLMIDRAAPGTDTLSSHTMTRGAVLQLSRWGLLPAILDSGTPAIRRSVFRFGAEEIALDLRPVADGPGMIAPRRAKLDRMLAEAAQAAGAELSWNASFLGALRDGSGRVRAVRIRDTAGHECEVSTRILIGADGLRSSVAAGLAADTRVIAPNRLGHVYGYYALPETSDNLGLFVPGVSVGLTPTDNGLSTVIVSASVTELQGMARMHGLEEAFLRLAGRADAELERALRAADRPEKLRLFAGHPSIRRRSTGKGWALIGDAGQFRDPVSSHGMTDAFRDGEHLARVLVEDDFDPSAYEIERDAITDPIMETTGEMTLYDGDPSEMKNRFIALSRAMRAEQDWMDARFAETALAA